VVIPLGVDRTWLDAAAPTEAQRTTLALPRRYLLFAGAAQPRKGLDVLLDAHASQPDLAPLLLAGPAGWGPAPTCRLRSAPWAISTRPTFAA
jgi:hypothetical protein